MVAYILPHTAPREDDRLGGLSDLLDLGLFTRFERIGVQPGWTCLEIGAGNGSVSRWLADRVGPGGHVVVSDIETNLIDGLAAPNLEPRRIDVTTDPLGGNYDLICARACLHHIPARQDAVARMVEALKPGGWLVLEEPDFGALDTVENALVRAFWKGFTGWAANQSIDYYIGRRLGQWLLESGLEDVRLRGEALMFQGGSFDSRFWRLTFEELGPRILDSGMVPKAAYDEAMAQFANPQAWNWACSFMVAAGRKPRA